MARLYLDGGVSIKKLQEILDEIDYPVLMEIVDNIWLRDDYSSFCWNTDDNLDDLENGDGNTYSVETFEGFSEYDGYVVVNAHNGCGQTITYFFNKEKEIKI